ncbi:MAG: PEP/pyruvate-binding domain-containing protein, partial [Actinomycetota bacterium]
GLEHSEIPTAEWFTALSIPAGDLVANGRVAKFLIDLRAPGTPRVHFVNGNFMEDGEISDAAKYHYFFARQVLSIPESLGEFNRVTYFTEPKTRYVAGVVHTYFLDGAPEPVYGLQFYPQDVVREKDIVDSVKRVKERITIPGARFAFVPTGLQQTTATVAPDLAAGGIELLTLDRALGAIRYLPLNTGEAWGYLRIFPASNNEPSPADIPVFDELPLDLSVVAGVITRAVQDASSHVNLKSKERGTPNMVLRDAGPEHPRLAPWRDRPVRFVVRADDFFLEASTDEEIAARLAERNNLPWIPLVWEDETILRSYDEMAEGEASDALGLAARYGSKAANLGFLAHRFVLGRRDQPDTPSQRLGYDLTPGGFGVPLSFYRNLVEYRPNAELACKLGELIEAERAGALSSGERARRAAEVQTLFLNAELPPEDLAAISAKLAEVLPGVKKIKVRSSANAEDVPNFDGAGLHDSFAATVDKKDNDDGSCRIEVDEEGGSEVKRKVKPRSLSCALKGVYASLWNKRAIEERSFARIEHATAAMGLAIVPAYDLESPVAANAVVITRVLNASGVYGYSLSLQEGNNLVTNPDPGTYSEITIAGLGLGDEPTSLTIT